MTNRPFALILTAAMITFTAPAMAQITEEVKNQAIDMAKDKVMSSSSAKDMVKDQAMDMAKDKVMGSSSTKDMVKDHAMDMAKDKVMGSSSTKDMVKDQAMDMAKDKMMTTQHKSKMSAPAEMPNNCPFGTTPQSNGTCMVTGDFKY